MERLVFPDTGEAAWWCVCAENECQVQAFGPHRTRESAQDDAGASDCGNAHFVTDLVGPGVRLRLGQADGLTVLAGWELLLDLIVAHNKQAR